MTATPRTLSEWTEQAVLEAVTKGTFESEEFDFKEKLPDGRDDGGKERLGRTCAAFANAAGGFLVFGIADDRSLSPAQRIVGIDSTLDFPEKFGSYPARCVPSVEWSFRNPGIALASGRIIHVVYIPKSWKAPHAIGSAEDGWRFLKRTNKGNEGMNIDEVRAGFLSFYEKRLRLQLLRAELEAIRESALGSILAPTARDSSYHLATFDLTVIESILSDAYPLIAARTGFISKLARLRAKVRVANNKTQIFFGIVEFPTNNKAILVRQHNDYMATLYQEIAQLAGEASFLLADLTQP